MEAFWGPVFPKENTVKCHDIIRKSVSLLSDCQAQFDCGMQFVALLDYIRYGRLDKRMIKTVENKLDLCQFIINTKVSPSSSLLPKLDS